MPKAAIHPKWERKTTGVRKAGLIVKSGLSTIAHNPGLLLKGAKLVGKGVALGGEIAAGTVTGGASVAGAGLTGASIGVDAAEIAGKFRDDFKSKYGARVRGGRVSGPRSGKNNLGI